jgi:hypothetical protein
MNQNFPSLIFVPRPAKHSQGAREFRFVDTLRFWTPLWSSWKDV